MSLSVGTRLGSSYVTCVPKLDSLTRLCLEGFLLTFLLVSGCAAPGMVLPAAGGGFLRPLQPGPPSLIQSSSAAQLSQTKPS